MFKVGMRGDHKLVELQDIFADIGVVVEDKEDPFRVQVQVNLNGESVILDILGFTDMSPIDKLDGCLGGILVFDLHDRRNLRRISSWVEHLVMFNGSYKSLPINLIGCRDEFASVSDVKEDYLIDVNEFNQNFPSNIVEYFPYSQGINSPYEIIRDLAVKIKSRIY